MSMVDPLAIAAKYLSTEKNPASWNRHQKMFSLIGYQPEKFRFVHYTISFRTSCRRAAAMICPAQSCKTCKYIKSTSTYISRYTSCMHMDGPPLLYVHAGLPVQTNQSGLWPCFDILSFDLESGVRVTCDVGYLCANFSLPRPICSRFRPDVRDRQTDVRQTDVRQNNHLMPNLLGRVPVNS